MRAVALAMLALSALLTTPTSLAIHDVAVFDQCGHAVPVGAGTNGYDGAGMGTYRPCDSPCATGVYFGRVWVAYEPECMSTADIGAMVK